MANKRKPDNIHLLKGTFQPCRHGKPEEKQKIAVPIQKTPPAYLDVVARAEWRRILKLMSETGVLTACDQSTLAQYCALYSQFQAEGGEFPVGRHTQLRLCAVELGLTPSSRSKIVAPVSPGKDDDF